MKRAFTLVELMIVVAVLGILAAIVLPTVQGHTSEAREAAAKDCLRSLRGQIEMYKMHHNNVQPGYVDGTPKTAEITANQFIYCSKPDGTASPFKSPTGDYTCGPYFPNMPENPFNEKSDIKLSTVFATDADDSTGWLYIISTGEIAVNSTGTDDGGENHYDY